MDGRVLPHSCDPATRIATCRSEMRAMAAAWRATARRTNRAARQEAEAQVFNQMIVALDNRLSPRGDGEDPNETTAPLTELRLLARGVSEANGWFPEDEAVRWRPEVSITGYAPGDRIRLSERLFSRLADACFEALPRQ